MSSLIQGYEYDIFISYRHNDNRSGWVTDFVNALQEELAATIKEPLSIYFDKNPHDGLLETHNVDKSLQGKLKCLIFIPIISQTYCDQKSFAWQHEFVAFNKLSKEEELGRDIKVGSGNVASRILPIKIHDLDVADKATIENEIGGVLRAIEFIFKTPGVNRPLRSNEDHPNDNQNKTYYRDQINKVANAVKDLMEGIKQDKNGPNNTPHYQHHKKKTKKNVIIIFSIASLLILGAVLTLYFSKEKAEQPGALTEMLERAERYLEEADRFGDKRYLQNAKDAIQKVLETDSVNERALYLLSIINMEEDTAGLYIKKIFSINPTSKYGLLAQAIQLFRKGKVTNTITTLEQVEKIDPKNKDALGMLSSYHMVSGDYLTAWKYANRYTQVTGEGLHELLSDLYLELGDFKEAKRQLKLKTHLKEFSCTDIENLQRIYLCEGDFEKLEQETDSICASSKCDKCPYWILRAKMHVGKFEEASKYERAALENYGPITWRYPAYVLQHVGKTDSALLILQEEIKFDEERLADTSYRQSIPLYSLAAIYAMQKDAQKSLKYLRQYADRGFEFGSEWYMAHDPLFDELQKDPEYFAYFIQIIQKAQAKKTAVREKIRELERHDSFGNPK